MESKVCVVSNPKRNHSDNDDEDNRDSKSKRRHSSRDRQSNREKYDKDSDRKYHKLKVGDPYYSGGTLASNRKNDDRYEDGSRRHKKITSRDRHEKENRSRNAGYQEDEQIGAPYYSGGTVAMESGEELSDEEDGKVGQRYYPTESTDVQGNNNENFWIKHASKDKRQDVVPLHQKKTVDLLTSKTGGAYIPPAKLRMMQESITDKSSAAYQRIAWEALKKSIHGLTNKVNVGNIGKVTRDLLRENIVRGRGLLCRSIMQAQLASTTYTHVFAAMVAIINTKFPNIGELLLTRCIVQFKRAYRRSEKSQCLGSVTFIAHLINQSVAHEILALELLTLFVETPTEDSIEVAVAFLKECGQRMSQVSKKGMNVIFDMLRNILHDGQLDKRVQYMIEVMFQIRKDGFKDHPAVIEELDLVPEEDQFTHLLTLDSAKDPQDILNVYKFDPDFEANEERYKSLRTEILGSDNEDESGSDEDGDDDDDDGDDDDNEDGEEKDGENKVIIDNTETNMIALRKTIYLTIHSSLDYEECAHKLMKMQLKPGQEMEMCHMFLDCCGEQRTYEKFFGLLAQRFCQINNVFIEPLEKIFVDSYATVHRLETNKLRNVARFFAHLLFTDSISWVVLSTIHLNEEETTSSSRIYIKILFQELAEHMGLNKLNARVQDPALKVAFEGIFPKDNPKKTRFSINFFTSIGLGGLTDELRDFLKVQPKQIPAVAKIIDQLSESSDSESDSSSSSSSSSSTSSSSTSSNSSSKSSLSNKNNIIASVLGKINKKDNSIVAEGKSKELVKNEDKRENQISGRYEERKDNVNFRKIDDKKDNKELKQSDERKDMYKFRGNDDKNEHDKFRKTENKNEHDRFQRTEGNNEYDRFRRNNERFKKNDDWNENEKFKRNEDRNENERYKRNEDRNENERFRRNEDRNDNERFRRNEDRNENERFRKNENRIENERLKKNENDKLRKNEDRNENERFRRNENERFRRNEDRNENERFKKNEDRIENERLKKNENDKLKKNEDRNENERFKRNEDKKNNEKFRKNEDRNENEKFKRNEDRNDYEKFRKNEDRNESEKFKRNDDRNDNDKFRKNVDRYENERFKRNEDRTENEKSKRNEDRNENEKSKSYENEKSRRNDERKESDKSRRKR